MDLRGRMLGNRYEILEQVGNGGMATVYKAKCHILNRFVAVKVLRDEFTTDEEFVKRFNSEAQSAASLTHPNIVSVYDVGSEGDLHYIVMELIKGKTLKEIINEDGAISWKWSVNVAIQIASALETAHKNNIIHRDIKPHNIIITEDGIAKVTDFGIAKAVSNSTITAFGSTIGSVHYFSPEHAKGGFTDPKSDLYSLGVVLYEMVTGKVPFNADTPVSVALKHMQEKPTEPIEINSNIPKSVNDIIMKAMQKDISLRYQTATEMLRDLSRAIKNPDSNFVTINNQEKEFATQRLSTIYDKSEVRQEKKEKGLKGFMKKHKALCITIGALLLFIITIVATYFLLNLTAKKDVLLPELVGKEQSQATYETEQLKLNLAIGGEQYSKDIPAGCIISQEPPYQPNYNIKEGETITVIISKGRNLVTVPKVVGKTEEEAITALDEIGLIVSITEEDRVFDKKVEAGIVIEQSVKEKEEIDAGETITLKVSKGIEMTNVPDLNGKTEEEAKTLAKEAGLKVKVEIGTDESKADGVVIFQDKEANSEVEKDSTITITINALPTEKKGTINVNVKSLLGGAVEYEEDGVTPKNVKLEIKIKDSSTHSTETTIYSEEVNPLVESVSTDFTSKGYVNIKVFVNGVNKKETGMYLEDETVCIIDKAD